MTKPEGSGTTTPRARLWLNMRPGLERPSRLVFLVAHAGAGPSSLRDVEHELPPGWGAFALALPGRERRLMDPPEWELDQLAAEAAGEAGALLSAGPYRSVPVAVAGQCSGVWLAYAILAAGGPSLRSRCRTLFAVSGLPWDAPRTEDVLPDDSTAMWEQLSAAGNTPSDVAVDQEIRELLEPAIRADYDAVSRFPHAAEPLEVPIVVVAGSRDTEVDAATLKGWSRYTPSLEIVWLPSGHLPMQEVPGDTARVMVDHLA
ncbi:thioesterase II family protein [Streptomyces sp. LZ34]